MGQWSRVCSQEACRGLYPRKACKFSLHVDVWLGGSEVGDHVSILVDEEVKADGYTGEVRDLIPDPQIEDEL